ncbi:hypothetical protein LEP1GSC126_0062 [Leptospira kirschneri str. 200801774]|nr:hypothetical protein LEP1GSC126_0062 [Leptospira kirschneri str. 200801774]
MAIRRRRTTTQGEQRDGAITMRVFAHADQPSAAAGSNRESSKQLRELRDMTKMELRDGNRKEIDNGSNKATSSKYGNRSRGSRNAYSVYSPICGFTARKSKTFSRSQLYTSEQNIQFDTGTQLFSRNGFDHNPSRNYTKNPLTGYNLLDLYPQDGYINSHITPTKNKKARRQPGSELDKSPTTDFCLSPLLFAVNQKI